MDGVDRLRRLPDDGHRRHRLLRGPDRDHQGRVLRLTPNQIIVFDTTTWGWITLLWGIIVLFAGLGCSPRRLGALVRDLVAAHVFEQLGFVGNSQYPLWALTVLFLTVMVLWALIVHWDDAGEYAV